MKQVGALLFTLICVGFSVFLLVSGLLMSVDCTRLSQETVEVQTAIGEETLRRERLIQETETYFSLSEIDRYAEDILKMQTPKAGQIVYIDLPTE